MRCWMVIIFVYAGEYFFVMENHYYNSSINHSPTSYNQQFFPSTILLKNFIEMDKNNTFHNSLEERVLSVR